MNTQTSQWKQRLKDKCRENITTFQVVEREIILLINSTYYFLQFGFILAELETFRLVVIGNNRILTNKCYKTVRGAKIAFDKSYADKSVAPGVKAMWSHNYKPDPKWLEEKLNLIGIN